MSVKIIRGKIPFSQGSDDPNSSALPEIVSFEVEINQDNTNQFRLLFEVLNCKTLILERKYFNPTTNSFVKLEETLADYVESINIEINNSTNFVKLFSKHKEYKTKFKLIASNKNGSVSKELELIDVGSNDLNVFGDDFLSLFSVVKTTGSYDEVDIKLTINKVEGFSLSNLSSLDLFYKRQDFSSFLTLNLNKSNPVLNKNESGAIVSYSFSFPKTRITRPSIGGFFNFFCRITANNFQAKDTEIITIYFDNLVPEDPNKPDSNKNFPEAKISDQTASLGYDVTVKFSEVFIHGKNINWVKNGNLNGKSDDAFIHRFLDTKTVPGLLHSDSFINDENSIFNFVYEFNYSKNNQETKGYFYPASVSDILPYIIVNKVDDINDSIVLFWKINDNFFDYSFFKNSISIFTTDLVVKLQYKNSSGSYVDLTNSFKLEKEKHFQESSQKFIVKISKQDVINKTLFNEISREQDDNATDNLKIIIVSHSVICTAAGVGTRVYTFNKLLIPHEWKYIVYDKYIPRDSVVRDFNDKSITLNLDNDCLRGIKLPEEGFQKFDRVTQIISRSSDTTDTYISTFDNKIFYKLSCTVSAFYLDPVIEGTVNSITLPSIPDDVFLIAPKVTLPPPNLKTISNGGRQAEAIVNLNEYGKIAGIQIVDPGEGYSLYKTELSKREQTFVDFYPVIKASYTVLSSNRNITKQFLTPQNASFDTNNLKASLVGGVRLSSVSLDKQLLESQVENPFSVTQKQELDNYLSAPTQEEVIITDNSVAPYNNNTNTITNNAEPVLDELWSEISKLYTEKYNNPLNEVNVYNEDNEAGVVETNESDLTSDKSYPDQGSNTTSNSDNSQNPQTDSSGGQAELFSLNNLIVVPDGSPAFNIYSPDNAPPWLTLMPLSVRSDGMWAFGPLPNMLPRAEMFNRMVMAINSLDEVRVIVPFIWLVNKKVNGKSFATLLNPADSEYKIISFAGGTTIETINYEEDYYLPSNGAVTAGASSSVSKGRLPADIRNKFNLEDGEYNISSISSQSVEFSPTIHPFLEDAIPSFIRSRFKKRFLGLVTETTSYCSSVNAPLSPGGGGSVVYCVGENGNSYERPIPSSTSLPTTKSNTFSSFQIFDSSSSLSAQAGGSAQAFSFSFGTKVDERGNKITNYCGYSCGDASVKSVDFVYSNMLPATFKL
jgi:hypothetical protein